MGLASGPYGHIRIASATPEQLPTAAAVLDEVSAWLEAQGHGQWPVPFPTERLLPPETGAICYLAWDGATAVATYTLQRRDPIFWPGEDLEAEQKDEPGTASSSRSVYIHRLAVRRGYRGLGRALLAEIERTARSWGATCLRLDCMAGNARIKGYYEDAGFEYRGDVAVLHLTWLASLYEKPLR